MIGSIPVGMAWYKKNNKKNNEYSEQWRLSWSATATIYILPIAAASWLQDCSSRCRLASFWFLHCLGMVNRVFFLSRFRLLFSSYCPHFFVVAFCRLEVWRYDGSYRASFDLAALALWTCTLSFWNRKRFFRQFVNHISQLHQLMQWC